MAEKDLALVPQSESPEPEHVLVRLGLTFIDGRELVFCSRNQSGRAFLIRPRARAVECEFCDSRHAVVGLAEAIGDLEVSVGRQVSGPCLELADFVAGIVRDLKSRARPAVSK